MLKYTIAAEKKHQIHKTPTKRQQNAHISKHTFYRPPFQNINIPHHNTNPHLLHPIFILLPTTYRISYHKTTQTMSVCCAFHLDPLFFCAITPGPRDWQYLILIPMILLPLHAVWSVYTHPPSVRFSTLNRAYHRRAQFSTPLTITTTPHHTPHTHNTLGLLYDYTPSTNNINIHHTQL